MIPVVFKVIASRGLLPEHYRQERRAWWLESGPKAVNVVIE